MTRILFTAVTALALAIPAVAGGHATGNPIVDARMEVMNNQAKALGILGDMAKGATAYDAAAAAEAAQMLLDAAAVPVADIWVAGTSRAEVPKSRTKPEVFENLGEIERISAELLTASEAMVAAAGEGPEAIGAALGAVGATCGSCHRAWRLPKE